MGALGDDVKSGWWLPSSSWATANSVCLAQGFQEAPDESPGLFLRLSCRKPRGPAPFKRLRSPGSPRPAFQHCNSVADGHRLSASPQAPLFLWPPQLSFLSPLGPFLSLALFTHSRRLPWKSHGPSSVRETERRGSSGGKGSCLDCHSLTNTPLPLSTCAVLTSQVNRTKSRDSVSFVVHKYRAVG